MSRTAAPVSRNENARTLTQASVETNDFASNGQDAPPSSTSTTAASTLATSPAADGKTATHQRFVFTDPVAFRYLEEDPSTQVLIRRTKLTGFETYLVEQWACSRAHPTFIITTYTGDSRHEVACGVLSVPTKEEAWSPRLRVYFKALNEYHAKRRETSLGTLMITNLSAFPSSLTVIPIPEGDPNKCKTDFFVNENLRRLGCSGRTGLTLAKPAGSIISKFYQLYRASDKIPVTSAVIELVKLCQVALMLFGKLKPDYADGLLCDLTEKGLNDWWVGFGQDFFNIEPHDGILGPTTVAALLGLLLGARNRLHAYGAPVSKDVFDIDLTKRAIAYFQKTQRMPKTRRLDHATLARLHRVTAKAASSEGWTVPKAIKGTVKELGGEGGKMVMDMVTGKDKSGITDVETPHIEDFVLRVSGARAKWLWQGKPRKGQSSDNMFSRLSDSPLQFQPTDQGGYEWSTRRKNGEDDWTRPAVAEHGRLRGHFDDRHRIIKRSPTERESAPKDHDSARGLERIKGAVGLRPKHGRDHTELERGADGHESPRPSPIPEASPEEMVQFAKNQTMSPISDLEQLQDSMSSQQLYDDGSQQPGPTILYEEHTEPPSEDEDVHLLEPAIEFEHNHLATAPSTATSVAGSAYQGVDFEDILPEYQMPDRNISSLLRRRNSLQAFPPSFPHQRNMEAWPRRMSFSIAEPSVLTWKDINDPLDCFEIIGLQDFHARLRASEAAAADAKITRTRLLQLEEKTSSWVSGAVSNVCCMEQLVSHDQEVLDSLYFPRLEEFHALEQYTHSVVDQEKSMLEEAMTELEVLGARLEYETNALKGKVEDVEDGVEEFERQVIDLENRVGDLEYDMAPKEAWIHWLGRVLLGVGTKPDDHQDSDHQNISNVRATDSNGTLSL